MNTKRFCDYNEAELIQLTNEELNDSIRIEAIQRGIKPPVTLSEALKSSEYRGYQRPAELVKVWRICESYHKSEFGWLSEQRAIDAAEGMVKVSPRNYNSNDLALSSDFVPSVEMVMVGVTPSDAKGAAFKAFSGDESDEFDKLRDECIGKFSEARQSAYNIRVATEKKAEYLRLAGGNEDIAKAFWEKAGNGAWPAE